MSTNGEIISQDYTSSIDNIKINDWTKIQMTNTLNLLNGESQSSFYKIEGEKVIYNMDTVKDYLTHICKKENGMLKTYKEMTDDIRSENIESGNKGGATSAWITAVEIALEYLGYDVGKIDGILGGDTGLAIKKYQRYNNLGSDGKPGPKTIEKLIKDIEIFEKNTERLQYIEETIKGNEKKYNFEGYIKFFNGYFVFSDKFINKLKIRYKNNIEKYSDNGDNLSSDDIVLSIDRILENVFKSGERCCIEYKRDNKNVKEVVSCEFLKKRIEKIIKDMYFGDDIKNIKLIPDFMLGYESYFLPAGFYLDYLRSLGITMEESKPFIEKYLKVKNKSSIKEIDMKKFFYEELDQEMLNFLFGVEITKQKKFPRLDVRDGLRLYKIKTMRGEENFGKGISSLLSAGMFDDEKYYGIINSILEVNLKYNSLPKYIELYHYLDKKGLKIDNDALLSYSVNKYLLVLRELDKYKIPYKDYLNLAGNDMSDYIKAYDFCKKNNLPLNVFNFFGGNLLYSASTLLIDLFKDGLGRELYTFLSKYPQKLDNLGGKEIKEIQLNTENGGYNFCFRGILEMIKSRDDITLPILSENPTEIEEQEWKLSWEKIIKEYENVLRNYISKDKDENGEQVPKNETFDKIFFSNAREHVVEDSKNGVLQGEHNLKDVLKNFTKNFEDCSNILDKNGNLNRNNQKKLIERISEYAKEHPNEKILVYMAYHGFENGGSSNGWRQEDRIKLSNISPNIKIMSIRCFFGRAYTDDLKAKNNIYSVQSSVGGYSNNSPACNKLTKFIRKGYKIGLGFHEMEIYARLHYNYSFTPLTEYMDYIDFRTGKKNHKIVGLADAGIGSGRDDIA